MVEIQLAPPKEGTIVGQTAQANDLFRKTVPSALLFYPSSINSSSPLLGMLGSVINTVMDFEFPVGDKTERNGARFMLDDGTTKLEVRWEIRETSKPAHAHCEEGYHCIICSTDIFQLRRKAQIPWDLEELAPMYESHELAIYIPHDPFAKS